MNDQNNEEQTTTENLLQQSSSTGHKLPEQALVAYSQIPRPISLMNMIHQWQPMGIRVTLKLPLISNDQFPLFFIRNGPFIPRWNKVYKDTSTNSFPPEKNRLNVDPPAVGKEYVQFAFNNTRNVYFGSQNFEFPDAAPPLTITHYDLPPLLSSMAMSFRKWRGDMQYRFRVTANFAVQGYLLTFPIKNQFSPIMVYNEYSSSPPLRLDDYSFRPGMQDSYVQSDASMFRHLEITMPYEYPTAYYDQYQWLERRVSPYACQNYGAGNDSTYISFEPHGDNWIALALRGVLKTTEASTVSIDLEYRACENFEFADPCLPPRDFSLSMYQNIKDNLDALDTFKVMPSDNLESDGKNKIIQRNPDGTTGLIQAPKNGGLRIASSKLGKSSRNE